MNSYPWAYMRVQIVQFGVLRLPHRGLRRCLAIHSLGPHAGAVCKTVSSGGELDGCGLGGPLDALGGQRDAGQFLQEHGGFPEGSRQQWPPPPRPRPMTVGRCDPCGEDPDRDPLSRPMAASATRSTGRIAPGHGPMVHSGLGSTESAVPETPLPGSLGDPGGAMSVGAGTLGIGMPSAAASRASVVCQFRHVPHALSRTPVTFAAGRLVIALASRYPAAVSRAPGEVGSPNTKPSGETLYLG